MKDSLLENTVNNMLQLMHLLRRKMIMPSEQIARGELTSLQFQIIRLLSANGPLAMNELAQEMSVSKQQLTQLVGKLQQKGYVTRQNDDNDRRVVRISLSQEGFQYLAALRSRVFAILESRLQIASDDELKLLNQSLSDLNEMVEKLF